MGETGPHKQNRWTKPLHQLMFAVVAVSTFCNIMAAVPTYQHKVGAALRQGLTAQARPVNPHIAIYEQILSTMFIITRLNCFMKLILFSVLAAAARPGSRDCAELSWRILRRALAAAAVKCY